MLVHVVMTGTPPENLTHVWGQIRQLYEHFNIAKTNRYTTLKLTMFKVGGGVKLRGKAGGCCFRRLILYAYMVLYCMHIWSYNLSFMRAAIHVLQERYDLSAQSFTVFGKCIIILILRCTERLSYACEWGAEWKQFWMHIETSSHYQESVVLGVLHESVVLCVL
jgi:hypothetical protein